MKIPALNVSKSEKIKNRKFVCLEIKWVKMTNNKDASKQESVC